MTGEPHGAWKGGEKRTKRVSFDDIICASEIEGGIVLRDSYVPK